MEKFFTTQSDFICHNGKSIVSKLPIDKSKYDYEEIGEMFDIVLEDGTALEAFFDEIIDGKFCEIVFSKYGKIDYYKIYEFLEANPDLEWRF